MKSIKAIHIYPTHPYWLCWHASWLVAVSDRTGIWFGKKIPDSAAQTLRLTSNVIIQQFIKNVSQLIYAKSSGQCISCNGVPKLVSEHCFYCGNLFVQRRSHVSKSGANILHPYSFFLFSLPPLPSSPYHPSLPFPPLFSLPVSPLSFYSFPPLLILPSVL